MSEEAGFNIDFGALKAQAAEMLDKAEATPAVEAKVETPAPAVEQPNPEQVRVKGTAEKPAAKVVDTPVEKVEAAALEAEPKYVELDDEALVKTIVDGKEVVRPWKEAKNYISGGLKFTQNMQALAKERQDIATDKARRDTLEAENNSFKAILQNKESLARFVQMAYGVSLEAQKAAEAVTAQDPNEIATVGQAEAAARAQFATVQQLVEQTKTNLEQRIVETQRTIEFERQKASHDIAINSTLTDIFTKNPVLKSIPNAQDVIRYEVSKMVTPETTEAEALEYFREVSKGIVEELGQHFKAEKTIRAIQKEKLETKTIEPATGAAPQLKPANYKNADGTVNWNKVRQMATDAF